VKSELGADVTVIDGGNPSNPDIGCVVLFNSGESYDSVLDGFTITNGTGFKTTSGERRGGGIYCDNASPTIINNIISGNSADFSGGGICCHSNSSPEIVNNIISHNEAGYCGAGIYTGVESGPNILNCTIFRNSSGSISYNNGGGLHCYRNGTDDLNITNTIFWENSASSGPEVYCSNASPDFSYSDIMGGESSISGTSGYNYGPGMIDADPLFVNPTNGSFHLQQDPPQTGMLDSPCVDSGHPGHLSFVDGSTRIDGVPDARPVDMGYHYPAAPFTLIVNPMPVVRGQPATFTVASGVPAARTFIVYSMNGPGSTYIPLLDVTLDLSNPRLGGNGVTLEDGDLEWIIPIPANAPQVSIWFQVCQDMKVSNVVETSIQ